MQKLALFLLLAVTASMIFTFNPLVFAQENTNATSNDGAVEEETPSEETTDEETPEEDTTDEETPEEDTTDDGVAEDETVEDEVPEEMEATMEEAGESVDSPLMQMAAGVDPHEIQCKSGQTLIFKASNWRPACVNESSFDVLVSRGWAANHDPTHDDLMTMQDDYLAAHPQEETEEETPEEDTTNEETPEEDTTGDGMTEEETTDDSTETESEGETQPQNYTVELSESINVSAL